MFTALFEALSAGLSLWNTKEKNKYVDRLMSLQKDYYDEYSKPPESRDDAVLDNIEHELCILANGFSAAARRSDSKN